MASTVHVPRKIMNLHRNPDARWFAIEHYRDRPLVREATISIQQPSTTFKRYLDGS